MVYIMQNPLLCLSNTFFIDIICSTGGFKMLPKKSPFQYKTEARNKQILPTDYTKSAEGIRQLYSLCLYNFSSP